MVSTRVLLALLVGLTTLTHPVIGNGPGPDTEYTYDVTPLNFSNGESVEILYNHPEVVYGTNEQLDITRNAANETVSRPEETISGPLRELLNVQFLADDSEDQYYRIDGRILNGTFILDTDPVSARTVADVLATSPENAPQPITAAMAGDRTSDIKAPATVVRMDGDFVIVHPAESNSVPDPYAIPKIVIYAIAVVLLVWAGVMFRTEV